MLVSLADMKTYLDITNDDYNDFLTSQITIVSDAIEGYCGRKILSAAYVQTFYGHDYKDDLSAKKLLTYHYPIQSIGSIKEIEKLNDGSENETALTIDEFLLNTSNGMIFKTEINGIRKYWFTEYGYNSRVVIQYTAGFNSTPPVIEDVVYALVSERYSKKINGMDVNFGSDVQRVSIPGVMSIDFDYTLQANERKAQFGMIIGNYANVLDAYKSERKVIGEIRENYVE